MTVDAHTLASIIFDALGKSFMLPMEVAAYSPAFVEVAQHVLDRLEQHADGERKRLEEDLARLQEYMRTTPPPGRGKPIVIPLIKPDRDRDPDCHPQHADDAAPRGFTVWKKFQEFEREALRTENERLRNENEAFMIELKALEARLRGERPSDPEAGL